MNSRELLRHVGSMQQLAYVRPVLMEEGRAKGMRVYDVKNGKLSFRVMADKCLDIAELSYAGESFHFLSKPGLIGRNHYDTNGEEARRSIMGGMLFTAGLENICAPCTVDGREYPMHGRIRTTPAEHLAVNALWEEGAYRMEISGEMREAELFGENLTLRRRITTTYPEPRLLIEDVICNESFREEPYMLLYHFNVGSPLLEEGAELVLPSLEASPRDEESRQGLKRWNVVESPQDNREEMVFLHRLAGDREGHTFAAVINRKLGLGLKLSFCLENLPYFMEWKSLASGDFCLGLEPANASVYGKQYHLERGDHPSLKPGETVTRTIELSVLLEEDFEAVLRQRDALLADFNKRQGNGPDGV